MGAIAEINGSRITSEFSSVDKIFLGSLSKLNDQQKLISRCRLEYVLSDLQHLAVLRSSQGNQTSPMENGSAFSALGYELGFLST